MSLMPILFNDGLFSTRPSRLLDQHFGMGLDFDDLLSPVNTFVVRCPAGYIRSWRSRAAGSDSGSTITTDKDKFQVSLDVQQFKPEEISVKVTGKNTITVEGKHEEKEDEHGFISRHFERRYVLPDGHDINNVVSSLSSDGVLNITAPRVDQSKDEQRTISIQQTGQPSKPIKKEQGDGAKEEK